MDIQITIRHTELPAQFRDYMENKIERLNKYFNKIQKINIIIDSEKYRNKVELLIKSPIFNVQVIEESTDLTAAFDRAMEVAEKRIQRLKEKNIDSKKNPKSNRIKSA